MGDKEFRYAIVPEQSGELVLPEIQLDWWDTVSHRQRTAMLPEHRVTVLPSELSPAAIMPPSTAGVLPDVPKGVSAEGSTFSGNALFWKIGTVLFAALWLLTWVLYLRRGRVNARSPDPEGSGSSSEKELLEHFQQACQKGDAPSARKDLAQWIRNYAPQAQRGSMRDFGTACGDAKLQMSIAELDVSGFADHVSGAWKGEPLWLAFKRWQAGSGRPQSNAVGEKPDLYAH